MIINIENTSSPGASFTEHTNNVILKTYELLSECSDEIFSFKNLRERMETQKNVNDNNNRNIYPLLKNCGLVVYDKNHNFKANDFFTNKGLAYVKVLETFALISSDSTDNTDESEALRKCNRIKQEIILDSLHTLVNRTDVKYVSPFKWLIKYLVHFSKIDIYEFAILIESVQKNESLFSFSTIEKSINDYRNNDIEMEVHVKVKNDVEIRKSTNSDNRKEGIRYLTSYSYFTNLLNQAGLIDEISNYHVISEGKITELKTLGGMKDAQ